MKRPEFQYYRPYVIGWFVLLVLLVAEIIVARLVNWPLAAPFFGVAMAGVVAFVFMDLRRSNNLTRIFALAGVFWMITMLGLGVIDPATRVSTAVHARTDDWRKPVTGPGGS
jgi:caa(3)-type oxidase subunit IV